MNFLDHETAELAVSSLQGFEEWQGTASQKTMDACWSDPDQGTDVLVERFRNSRIMHYLVPDEYTPALFQDGGHFVAQLAGLAKTRQVAFDVGHEHRHADAGEPLGHGLQRDGFAGAGGASDQPVPVGLVRAQEALDIVVLGNQDRVGHKTLEKYNLAIA